MGCYLEMEYINKTKKLVQDIIELSETEGKLSGFCIGNTAKIDPDGIYFMPIRNTTLMVVGGAIVYTQKQAVDISRLIDGNIKYVLVDAEKKISSKMTLTGEPANVERAVRESIHCSKIWVYKGNDLSVDAVDALLTQITKNSIQGIGSAKVTILGAGNLGAKLALKLVERGAHVTITRRTKQVLDIIVQAVNYIKPIYTTAAVIGTTNNEEAARGAEILIGTTQGNPVITPEIVSNLADHAIIVDVGKGTIYPDAIELAKERGLEVYRLDVSAAFEGLVHKLWATENIVEKKFGRRLLYNESLISGGILGKNNEIVVDNVWLPTQVYGIADGRGDFVRDLSEEQINRLKNLKELIKDSKR